MEPPLAGDHGPLGDIGAQLERIEDNTRKAHEAAAAAKQEATQAYEEARANRTGLERLYDDVVQIKQDLYGPEEERRRGKRTGLVQRVDHHDEQIGNLQTLKNEAKAVVSTRRWAIGASITLGTLMVMLIGIVLRAAG